MYMYSYSILFGHQSGNSFNIQRITVERKPMLYDHSSSIRVGIRSA